MNPKKLIVLVVALVAVIGLIVIAEKAGGSKSSGGADGFFPGVTAEKIGAVTIADRKDTLTVKRKGDIWIVTDAVAGGPSAQPLARNASADGQKSDPAQAYDADSASVQAMIEKLENMKKGDIISNNPEKQEVFEVDSANGVLVTVFDRDDKQLGSFRIGKSGPDWSSHYVRSIGSDEVYSVGGSIRHAFFTDLKRWRDKTVLSFEPASAQRITLAKKGAEPIVLEKSLDSLNQPQWEITSPEKHPASKQEVGNLVNKLSSLKTTGWASDTVSAEALSFEEPELRATVLLENGDEKILTVGGEADGKFFVRVAGRDVVYRIAEYTISDIDKNLEALKAAGEETAVAESGQS